jgi:hypothetical protein
MKAIELVLAVVTSLLGGYIGTGLGAAAGASCQVRDVVMPDAIAFWFYIFVPLSLALATPRTTRWAAAGLLGGYVVTLCIGYAAGCHWGNFVGWHPD